MPKIMLIKLIEDAMDLYGGDGLWNGKGPCGCGRGDLNPGDCLSVDCVIAKSKAATENDIDDCIEVGDIVWFPIQVRTTDGQSASNVQDQRAPSGAPLHQLVGCEPFTGEKP